MHPEFPSWFVKALLDYFYEVLAVRDKKMGYSTSAEYYIVKPFDNDLLVSTVQEVLAYE